MGLRDVRAGKGGSSRRERRGPPRGRPSFPGAQRGGQLPSQPQPRRLCSRCCRGCPDVWVLGEELRGVTDVAQELHNFRVLRWSESSPLLSTRFSVSWVPNYPPRTPGFGPRTQARGSLVPSAGARRFLPGTWRRAGWSRHICAQLRGHGYTAETHEPGFRSVWCSDPANPSRAPKRICTGKPTVLIKGAIPSPEKWAYHHKHVQTATHQCADTKGCSLTRSLIMHSTDISCVPACVAVRIAGRGDTAMTKIYT